MMFLKEKRKFRFLNEYHKLVYDTAFSGWTLVDWKLSNPEKQTSYVQIPGRDGAVDLFGGLTDGEPKYKQRTLTIELTCSERDRKHRLALVDDIVNTLDGFTCWIIDPDDPTRYIRGVCSVNVEYNDLNRCGVKIEAACDPWRVSQTHVQIDVAASATEKTLVLSNNGRRKVIPYIGAYADGGAMPDITITSGTYTTTLTNYSGIFATELALGYKQTRTLTYSGSGHLTVQWQEAIL